MDGYRQFGNADRLDLAIQLFGHVGHDSAQALLELAHTPEPGQEAFVELAAGATFLAATERSQLLEAFGRSSALDTRARVLELIEILDPESQKPLLALLARDQNEILAEDAAEALATLTT
ncbi:MAG: hypothetical protein V3W41_04660 [Planctomycetota bacterium]